MKYLVQYHSFELQGKTFPGHGIKDDAKLSESSHLVSSKKKQLLYSSKGDTVFLIFGIMPNKNEKKKYFLWSKTIIEKPHPKQDSDGFYNASGDQYLLCPPYPLNFEEGFDEFIDKMSNFSIGLTNITTWKFLDQLKLLSEKYECKNLNQITYKQYIDNFIAISKIHVFNK